MAILQKSIENVSEIKRNTIYLPLSEKSSEKNENFNGILIMVDGQ